VKTITVLISIVLAIFAVNADANESQFVCFEANYYHPNNALAERYSAYIPAEQNPKSDVDLMLSVFVDVSQSSQVAMLWEQITRSQQDQWVCAEGRLVQRQNSEPSRLINRVSFTFFALRMWEVFQENQIPENAMVLERY
jgi:hypothetical protein